MLKRDEDLDRNCLRERAATLGLNVLLAEFESEALTDRSPVQPGSSIEVHRNQFLPGEPSMPMSESRFGAFLVSSVLCCTFNLAQGDEPVKPTAPATETNPAVPAPGHSVHGEAFNDGPRHAAYIMPGMGEVHFAVATKMPEAQKSFIDQGVAQLPFFLLRPSPKPIVPPGRQDRS